MSSPKLMSESNLSNFKGLSKLQRTGKTEGCLIFNHYLKKKYSISFVESEELFINWLYTTSGWYDSEIDGSNMDIDTRAVKESPVYHKWLEEYTNSLKGSDHVQIMYHKFYFPKVDINEFRNEFPRRNLNGYWQNIDFLKSNLKGKILIINPFAEIIKETYPEYNIIPFVWPYTFFNSGPDKNAFKTLDRLIPQIPTTFDTALISAGSYGCILADRLNKPNNLVMTIGSGLHNLFPVKKIPKDLRPDCWMEIDGGKYWKGLTVV